jgi:hypothetical protein
LTPGLGGGAVRVWVVTAMAAARDHGEARGSAERMGSEPSLEELLQSLDLKEKIGAIFVAKKDVETLKEGSKWMAIMKLLTTKTLSATSLKKTIEVFFLDGLGHGFCSLCFPSNGAQLHNK